jgi:small subunit ribosomal protein S1
LATKTSNNPSKNSDSPMSAMAQLMAKQGQQAKPIKKGEQVEGTITKVTKNEILMDVNGKSEALVLERDKNLLNNLLSSISVGDTVTATILSAESENGQPIVSLRRFMDERNWQNYEKLQKENKAIEVTVTDVTKGGLVVQLPDGMSGFLPQSHMAPGQQQTAGKKISVFLLELNRSDNRLIVTQKETISDDEFRGLTKSFKPGQKIDATLVNITPFGLFLTIPIPDMAEQPRNLDGLIHISEISWEKVDDLAALYTVGQTITAQVIGVDMKAKRLDLSVKRMTEDPFTKIGEKYPVDSKVNGTVSRIDDGNVYIKFADSSTSSEQGTIEGVIRKEKVPMGTTYTEGQAVNVTISEIDTRRHRILLSPVLLEKPIGYR